ncbi:MAG: hypothetical protein A2428_08475 [Bdellovibrionales bacterium RIFOXYC1_FULL_54_43]|nr:MAG: hypothetical protein A2428_08475 [Bdellovibrionales bacterium RIFOXYC1_FULL_54_43]OFZ80352.1 MAG: hypothetical protein A2603_13290 [Bdellovibrionales bacterium RIFOXYD1_FULL_55_31]
MNPKTQKSIILTISTRSGIRQKIWAGNKPLLLGRGRNWKLERSEEGVRLRQLTGNREYLFKKAELEAGARLDIEGASVVLRNRHSVRPAYVSGSSGTSGALRIYERSRGWTFNSTRLGAAYVGNIDDIPVFSLKSADGGYRLTALASESIRLCTSRAVHELKPLETIVVNFEELLHVTVRVGAYDWSFNSPEEVPLAVSEKSDPDWTEFKRSFRAVGSFVAVFLFVSILWPRSEVPMPEEPMPVQDVALSNPIRFRVAAASSGAGSPKKAPSAKQPTAVASAFEGDKLQNAMKGLFRGGMTQLLAKSEYGPGVDKSASARRLFNSSSPAIHSVAPITGPGTGRGTHIGALGGGGQGDGKGVGYGRGEHVGIQGQGRSLVAMDTTGSSVEEGLTKDEVGKVIHRHLNEIRYCYESSIIHDPDLEGKLVLGFTINGSGRVKTAAVRNSTVTGSNLDDCIVRRLVAWRFPQTKGGIDVGVTYPFIFKTLGG